MRKAKDVSGARARGREAEALLTALFEERGWKVERYTGRPDYPRPDLLVRRGKASFAVEVKSASEGRSDRLIPLWSQACLQATRAARAGEVPLVVVAAPRIKPHNAEKILAFAAEYAPAVAAGVIDFAGLRRFRGVGLEDLDAEPDHGRAAARAVGTEAADLFSDLNQWLLKVLLAPEIPERLLTAPRERHANASQLAAAADVSVMTAFRLVRQLEQEGYLHEGSPYLRLVRREELFRRWQGSAARRIREAPVRFLLRGDLQTELKRILKDGRACLGLFAAADALDLGFVSGVPPYVYVKKLGSATLPAWKNLVPAEPGETPDVILRQAPAPKSVFRGVVRRDEVAVCDVLQVWLDVSSHPSRGKEQADLIRRRVLQPVIEEEGDE